MNIKKSLIVALASVFSFTAMAQEEQYEYEFQPYWYGQVQVGGQHTLGEIDFSKLLSPNAQIAVGYQFDRIFGARLSLNAWQSKAGSEFNVNNTVFSMHENLKWKWNYIAPSLDFTMNLSDALYGFNPNRVFNLGIFAGVGMNVAFKNDEASNAYTYMKTKYPDLVNEDVFLRYHWTGTKCRMTIRAGLTADFKVSDKVKVGLELNANTLSDRYNSKKAGGSTYDWYFNGLVGLKYNFGNTYNKKKIEPVKPEVIIQEKIVEKIIEKPVEGGTGNLAKRGANERDPFRIDVFFTIASTKLLGSEAQKVNEIAKYLQKYPDAKVTITGYADKGTGNAKINLNLSEKRAQIVKDALIKKYGIAENRIVTDFKGDTVQPFDVEVLNRVSICIAE